MIIGTAMSLPEKHILYIPGKNPKPPHDLHKMQLWRCLGEGLRRADPTAMALPYAQFHLADWNHLFYETAKDISADLPWIDQLLHTHGPSPEDIHQANSWRLKLAFVLYNLIDIAQFLIPLVPDPKVRDSVQETRRYFRNDGGIAFRIRSYIKSQLLPLLDAGKQVLVIGHSLGSIIAYDTFWEMTWNDRYPGKLDFLTIGSPLGMRYVQRYLLGWQSPLRERYPAVIHDWINVSAVGDLTSLDQRLHDDFHEMLEQHRLSSLEDHCCDIYNFFHNHEGLNVHRSYGYLINPATGRIVAEWLHQPVAGA